MNYLITGATSFIGKHLKQEIMRLSPSNVTEFNEFDDVSSLRQKVEQADIVFHLLTTYKATNSSDFFLVNVGITEKILSYLYGRGKKLILLSSIRAGDSSDYGKSKLLAEKLVEQWEKDTGNKGVILRLANEFGKWCPPNLNSVVATFCHNISHNIPVTVFDPNRILILQFIDDIITKLIHLAQYNENALIVTIEKTYPLTVSQLVAKIQYFHLCRQKLNIPEYEGEIDHLLYSTFLSYLPIDYFSVDPISHQDSRGSFTELLHLGSKGQVSVNISKPGITKGNHWHNTKHEKFIVVSGKGEIKFRQIGKKDIIVYNVCGDKIQIIDIPPGYSHNITNIGQTDLITIMWANEIFNSEVPDTIYEEI